MSLHARHGSGVSTAQDSRRTRGQQDAPGKCEERLLDALVDLCRGLHELDAELVGKLAALLFSHRALVRPVRLVANENLVYAFRGVLLDVRMPGADICGSGCALCYTEMTRANAGGRSAEPRQTTELLTIKRPLVGDVVHQQDAHSTAVVRGRDRPEALLARSIPLRRTPKVKLAPLHHRPAPGGAEHQGDAQSAA